jgi:hypothetical protein
MTVRRRGTMVCLAPSPLGGRPGWGQAFDRAPRCFESLRAPTPTLPRKGREKDKRVTAGEGICSFPSRGKAGMGAGLRSGAAPFRAPSCPHPDPPPEGEGERQTGNGGRRDLLLPLPGEGRDGGRPSIGRRAFSSAVVPPPRPSPGRGGRKTNGQRRAKGFAPSPSGGRPGWGQAFDRAPRCFESRRAHPDPPTERKGEMPGLSGAVPRSMPRASGTPCAAPSPPR